MMKQSKGFIAGIIVGVLLAATLSITFAAPVERTITALFSNIKIYIDGELYTPKDANGKTVEPFVYNDTTYLPVRAVATAFDKAVEWDGDTQSIYIGRKEEAEKYLLDIIEPYDTRNYLKYSGKSEVMAIGGGNFYNGFVLGDHTSNTASHATFNLNKRYKELTCVIGHLDSSSDFDQTVKIYADGKLIQTVEVPKRGDAQPVTLNVIDVLDLKFERNIGNAKTGFGNIKIK